MSLIIPNHYIEHTNLKPNVAAVDISKIANEALEYNFKAVCIPPFWVKTVKRELSKSEINIVTVVGFPFGYQKTESKITEISGAVEDGADELDIVLNISAYKSGMTWPKIELTKCNQLIHSEGKLSKIIIETGYLSKLEIEEATKMAIDSGTDYIKTSTGVLTTGADLEDVKLIKSLTKGNVGLKASGGIKTLLQLTNMINAGADRIGTSAGVSIMKEYYNG